MFQCVINELGVRCVIHDYVVPRNAIGTPQFKVQGKVQPRRREAMMDTKTLVVGQDVYIFDDCYNSDSGKVTKITPGFVEVTIKVNRIAPGFTPLGVELNIGDEILLTFDRNGKGEDGQFTPGGYGVWHIDDMPFAERTALNEDAARKWELAHKK